MSSVSDQDAIAEILRDLGRVSLAPSLAQNTINKPTGVLQGRLPDRAAPPLPDVNKQFLSSTIRSVESHNRREVLPNCSFHSVITNPVWSLSQEVDACYRIRRLERSARSIPRRSQSAPSDEDELSREHWAELKVRFQEGLTI